MLHALTRMLEAFEAFGLRSHVCAMQVTLHCSQTDSSGYGLACVCMEYKVLDTGKEYPVAPICSSVCGWAWTNGG